MDALPDFVFLGYRAKRPLEWGSFKPICCVGDSLCEPPEGWMQREDSNRACCYPTPEAAWATVPGDRAAYRLFAYALLPLDLYDGEPPELAPLDEIFSDSLPDLPNPPSGAFDMAELGYDVAEHRFGDLGYPHSPLMNNAFGRDFPVNRYGLLDDLATALRACEVINDEMPEHAPHWVFRVYAKAIDDSLGF